MSPLTFKACRAQIPVSSRTLCFEKIDEDMIRIVIFFYVEGKMKMAKGETKI